MCQVWHIAAINQLLEESMSQIEEGDQGEGTGVEERGCVLNDVKLRLIEQTKGRWVIT